MPHWASQNTLFVAWTLGLAPSSNGWGAWWDFLRQGWKPFGTHNKINMAKLHEGSFAQPTQLNHKHNGQNGFEPSSSFCGVNSNENIFWQRYLVIFQYLPEFLKLLLSGFAFQIRIFFKPGHLYFQEKQTCFFSRKMYCVINSLSLPPSNAVVNWEKRIDASQIDKFFIYYSGQVIIEMSGWKCFP